MRKLCSRTILVCFKFAAFLSLFALLLTLNGAARADESRPFLHPLFTDNMVLQRGVADPVWGWTTPGSTVVVTLDGKTAKAMAGSDGKWLARIGPIPAGGPYTLTVSGPQSVTLHNVMVGDVWLCSGQSNMEFGLGLAVNADQEIANANHPGIRLFLVSHTTASSPRMIVPVNASDGHWQVCSPQTVTAGGWSGFSAVGYFFARDLQADVHVPIGLIQSTWGGTVAEAWTSAPALSTMPDFHPAAVSLQRRVEAAKTHTYDQLLAAWYARYDPGSASGLGWADPALDTSAWKTMPLPQLFQDAGDPQLANTNGVVWFRRTFDLPAGDTGKDAVLHLQVDDNDTTWVNGTKIGATEGSPIKRAYNIASALLKPSGNLVAVRVLDTGGKGGIYGDPAGLTLEVPSGAPVPLSGAWAYKLGAGLPPDDPPPLLAGGDKNDISGLYNGMISPLQPFGIKGVLWYQGEANSGRGKQYETLLPTLIADWRTRFDQGKFPFLIVQLADYAPSGPGWPEIQEAQLMIAKTVPNVGIATASDIGDPHDVHPRNKQEVGRRLALVALGKVYGRLGEYYGPIYQAMTVQGEEVKLTFSHLGGGLVAKDGKPLTEFWIAGADGVFVPAVARIDGSAVVVSASAVPHPAAVRYGWTASSGMSLYSKTGLPAFPFRTDVPLRGGGAPKKSLDRTSYVYYSYSCSCNL